MYIHANTPLADALFGGLPPAAAAVGAGGKTSLLRALAFEARDAGKNTVLTTTTHIYPEKAPFLLYTGNDPVKARALLEDKGLLCCGSPSKNGKLEAPPDAVLQALRGCADVLLIEADGSRGMPVKLPADFEPVIPEWARGVLVLGLSAMHQPLEAVCHRAELCGRFGIAAGQNVTPEVLAALANAYSGKCDAVFFNQADGEERLEFGIQAAKRLDFQRVAIGTLRPETVIKYIRK